MAFPKEVSSLSRSWAARWRPAQGHTQLTHTLRWNVVLLIVGSILILLTPMLSMVCQSQSGSESVVPREQQTVRQLEPGKPLDAEISGGQLHSFSIEAEAGQYIHIEVYQRGIDVMVTLLAPDGNKIFDVDRTEAFGPETVLGVMQPPGKYRLEVRPVDEQSPPGSYTIRIKELRAAREEDKVRISKMTAAFEALAEGDELRDKEDAASLKGAIERYNNALTLWRQTDNKYWEAFTLTNNLGVTYRLLYDKRQALDADSQALRIFRALTDRGGEATALNNIGSVYNSLWESVSEKRKALDYYNQALSILKEIGDRSNEGAVLSNTGLLCQSLGEYQKALEYYNQALSIKTAVGDPGGEAITLLNIGSAYNELGEELKALDYYNRALPILKAVGNHGGEASALRNIGFVYDALGETQKAMEFYNQSLPIFQTVGDRAGEADTLNSIGSAYDSLSEMQKALDCYNQALQLRRQVGDHRGEAVTLVNIGHVSSALGEKQGALEYYTQALTIFTAIADPDNAETSALIGTVYSSLGEQRKALEFYNRALPIIRATGGPSREAQTLEKIGSAYNDLGEWEKALTFFNQALPIFRAAGNPSREADMLNNIGLVYDSLGETEKALEFYQQALGLFKRISDRKGEAVTLNNLGSIYSSRDDKQKALEFYLQAWRLHQAIGYRGGEATMLNNIGLMYSEFDHTKEALEFFNLALSIERAIGDRDGEATTLDNLGSLYNSLNERQKALDSYYQSLAIRRTLGDRNGEANTLSNLSALWWGRNASLGILYGKQSVNVYQQLRGNITGLAKDVQRTFLRSVDANYRLLSDLLIAQDRLPEAHQVLNLFKDQQFFDFNRDTNRQASRVTLTAHEALIVERYEQITERLRVTGHQLGEVKLKIGGRQPSAEEAAQLQRFEAQLKSASDEFLYFGKQMEAEFKQQPSERDKAGEIADTRELQTALRDLKQQTGQKSVAIYTLAGVENFRALIVSPDRITAVSQLVKSDTLNEKALQLWGLLQTDRYDPKPLAQELYSIVFKPIESQLPKDTNTILWSLDGNLRYLPMGALHDGKQYLIERYNNVVFTRADRERFLRAVSPSWTGLGLGSSQAHTVVLLGDKIAFNALPGVTEELRTIFRQKGSTNGIVDGEVLPDARFTKTAMLSALQQKRPLVHISSHFSFRPGDEARSFLLLGDGTAMTLEEMKQKTDLFAGVELLTLSACNTAAQQAGANGREIDGFAELAQRLGAGAVMATLWPVADNSTPWLMREFYQTRQNGNGLTKAEAFRRAQLALLNGTAQTKPLPAAQKGPSSVQIVITGNGAKHDAATRADIVYIAEKDAPTFTRDDKKPFAHPYYWAPFILIGNWK